MPLPYEPIAALDIGEVEFISLVPKGDNPEALIVLAKADPRNTSTPSAGGTVGGMANRNTPTAAGAPAEVPLEGMSPEVTAILKGLQEQNELLKANLVAGQEANALMLKALEDELDDDDDEPEDGDDELDDEDEPGDDDGDDDDDEVGKSAPVDPRLVAVLKAQADQIEQLTKAQADAEAKRLRAENAYLGEEFSKRAGVVKAFGAPEGMSAADLLRKAYDGMELDDYVVLEKWIFAAAQNLADNEGFGKELGYSDDGGEAPSRFEQLLAKTGSGSVSKGAKSGQLSPQEIVDAMNSDPSMYDELLRGAR